MQPDPRRQFHVLFRDFLRRMVDLELLSAHGEIERLFGQFAALLGAFSLTLVFFVLPTYRNSGLSREARVLASWGVEEFLISCTMAVVGVFAVISWDSLLPGRRDSLVLGMLPVTSRTMLKAKVAAIATGLGVSMIAINSITGLALPFGAVPPGPLWLVVPRTFLAHWFTMIAAGVFVFCALLALQGIAAQVLSHRLFLQTSSFLQVAAFFLILAAFFLTPGAADLDVHSPQGQWLIRLLPSYWFTGLFQALNGVGDPTFTALASRALWGLGIVLVLTGTVYSLAFTRGLRRIIEQPDIAPSDRRRPATRLVWFLSARLLKTPLQRAVLLFVARTMARSRQHRNILAAFAGLALAISLTFARNLIYGRLEGFSFGMPGLRPPAWDDVNVPFLAGGFVILFFVVIGTRAAYALPTTLKANWIFQITAIHSPQAYLLAVRKSVYGLGALPVVLGTGAVYLAIWPRLPALGHIAVMSVMAIILVERTLAQFRKMPFACSYLPGKSNLKFKLGAYGLIFLFVTYVGAGAESNLLRTFPRAVMLFIVLGLMAWSARRKWNLAVAAPYTRLEFEDREVAEVSPLDLTHDGVYARAEQYVDLVDPAPPPTFVQRARAFARRFALITLALAATGAVYEQVAAALHPRLPQIGRSVDIGGRSLNIYCSGEGQPAVIFESGAGAAGYRWAYVQREVARFTRACWYDRAGYGWSDSGPYPRDGAAIAEDLHRLVGAAPEPGPFVLVGMSFGGLIVRIYNRHYPEDVAGMVLVDSTHVDENDRILPPGGGWIPYAPYAGSLFLRGLRWIGVVRLTVDDLRRRQLPVGLTPEEFRISESFEPRTMAENSKELYYETALEARAAGGLGDRPLIVLTAGKAPLSDDISTARDRRRFQEYWINIQKQLAALSSHGTQIVVPDASHCIQCDRPDIVIDSIRNVVDQARASQTKDLSVTKR